MPGTKPTTGDIWLDGMLERKVPLTRENYFGARGLREDPSQPQDGELESSLPWRFRHPLRRADDDDELVIFPPGM